MLRAAISKRPYDKILQEIDRPFSQPQLQVGKDQC